MQQLLFWLSAEKEQLFIWNTTISILLISQKNKLTLLIYNNLQINSKKKKKRKRIPKSIIWNVIGNMMSKWLIYVRFSLQLHQKSFKVGNFYKFLKQDMLQSYLRKKTARSYKTMQKTAGNNLQFGIFLLNYFFLSEKKKYVAMKSRKPALTRIRRHLSIWHPWDDLKFKLYE